MHNDRLNANKQTPKCYQMNKTQLTQKTKVVPEFGSYSYGSDLDGLDFVALPSSGSSEISVKQMYKGQGRSHSGRFHWGELCVVNYFHSHSKS